MVQAWFEQYIKALDARRGRYRKTREVEQVCPLWSGPVIQPGVKINSGIFWYLGVLNKAHEPISSSSRISILKHC